MAKIEKYTEKVMSPVGTASFPHINVADTFMGKTTYNVKLRLKKDDPETQAFVDAVEKVADKAIASTKEQLEKALKKETQPKKKQEHCSFF